MFNSKKSLPVFIAISTVLATIGMGKMWGMNEVKPLIVLGMQQQSSMSKVYNVYVLGKNKDKGSFYSGLFENNDNQNTEMSNFLNKLYVQDIVSDDKEKIIKMVLLDSNISECPSKTEQCFYFFVKIGTYANQKFTLEKSKISSEKPEYSFEILLTINDNNKLFKDEIKKLETPDTKISSHTEQAIVEMEKLKKKSDQNTAKIVDLFELKSEKRRSDSGYDDGLSASDVTIFSSIVSALFNGLVGSVMHFLPQNKKTVAAKTAIWGVNSWLFTHKWPFAHKKQNLVQKMCVGMAGAAGLYAGTKAMPRLCGLFKQN